MKKEDLTVYSKVETLEKFPMIDLKQLGYIAVIRGNYPEDGPFRNQINQFLNFYTGAGTQVADVVIEGAMPFQYNNSPGKLVPCESLKTDISNLNVSKDQLKGALCLEFTEKIELGGSFVDDLLRTIHINIGPCEPSPPELLCQAQRYNPDGTPDGPQVSTSDVSPPAARLQTQALLAEFLKDFTVEFGYIDDSPGLDDFKKPLIRSLNFHHNLRINSHYISNYKYYLSQTVVETTSGFFMA